jgi:hypothetical protein
MRRVKILYQSNPDTALLEFFYLLGLHAILVKWLCKLIMLPNTAVSTAYVV